MKLTLNTESSNLLVEVKKNSGLNFNYLLKEALELLSEKYNNKQKDQYDPSTSTSTGS